MKLKDIGREIYYCFIILSCLFVFTLFLNIDIIRIFFIYSFKDFIYHAEFDNPIVLIISILGYSFIPSIVIFIKLKKMKINSEVFLKYFLINILIF
jgi:hypothetical protein